MRKVWCSVVVVGMAFGAVVACGSGSSSEQEPLSYDEAVDVLVQQGYTPDAARCFIDGAAQQKVDLPDFLVTGKMEENTQVVIDAVGSYCVEQFGGTSIPASSTSTP